LLYPREMTVAHPEYFVLTLSPTFNSQNVIFYSIEFKVTKF
jgi:hypothetical protein